MTTWDYDLAVGEPDHLTHTGLLLAEDAAMKTYLSGLTVPGRGEGDWIDVGVWFRYPEGERREKYPFITIDFLGINPSFERWTSSFKIPENAAVFRDPETGEEVRRGMYIPSVASELPELEDPDETGYSIDNFLMYTLMYQVTTFARSALHDRYLTSRFMTDVFPPRSFFIGVDADATWRRCELASMQAADTYETTESGNKRVFRKVYTVTMDAEIPQSRMSVYRRTERVHADVYDLDNGSLRESVSHDFDDPHTRAEPVTVVPPPGP